MLSQFPPPSTRDFVSVVSGLVLQFGVHPPSVVSGIIFDQHDSTLCFFSSPVPGSWGSSCLSLLLSSAGGVFVFFCISLQFEVYTVVHMVHQFLDAPCLSMDVVPRGDVTACWVLCCWWQSSLSSYGGCFLSVAVCPLGCHISQIWWHKIHSLWIFLLSFLLWHQGPVILNSIPPVV